MDRLRKASRIAGITVGVLIVGAIVLGILNALVADGTWTFGWNDYRYDDSGYTVGDGSVPAEKITRIDLDWIDGSVTVVPCEDMFISLSERSETPLTDETRVHWRVEENGVLSVKYRASSWFFGTGKNKEKELILRVPKAFFEELTELTIHTATSEVRIEGIAAPGTTLYITTERGDALVSRSTFYRTVIDSEKGEVTLSEVATTIP